MERNLNTPEVRDNSLTTNIKPKLVGTATRQELIERKIIFDAPKKDVVLKVVNIINDIEIKDTEVTDGVILVSGYLNSCIVYTTLKRPQSENNNQGKNNGNNSSENHGYVNDQNNKSNKNNKNKEEAKPGCSIVNESIALDGVVRHITVWIPFKSFVAAPEAQAGDISSVTSSAVLDDLKSIAIEPIYEEEEEEENGEAVISTKVNEEEHKFIKGIVTKALIELNVDIKRYSED